METALAAIFSDRIVDIVDTNVDPPIVAASLVVNSVAPTTHSTGRHAPGISGRNTADPTSRRKGDNCCRRRVVHSNQAYTTRAKPRC